MKHESFQIMDDQGIKTSQRVSRSCIECSRRKIKCDKKIPCQPCRRRNVAHECRRPLVRVKGQLTVYSETPEGDSDTDTRQVQDRLNALAREKRALQAKIAELETALALSKPCAHSHVGASGTGDEPFPPTSLEDIVPAFERFDLDIEHDPVTEATSSSEKEIADRLYAPAADPIFLLLPSRQASSYIIHYSLSTLGWLHCAVDADAFLYEHDEFWDATHQGIGLKKGSRPWLAVYLGLLAAGILYMDPEDLPATTELPQMGIPVIEPIQAAVHLSRLWYEASLKEIEAHGFSGAASLAVVQTLSILTLCHSNFGERQREWLFTGFAFNMAKYLDMHRLGTESTWSGSLRRRPEWQTPAQRELGRRLWWTCVIRDWLGGWNRPPSISPASFCCQFSTEGDVEDNVMPTGSSPAATGTTNSAILGPPSPIHYHFAMSRLAYIFYIYIKANTHHTPSKFAKAIEEIRVVRQNLPLHLTDKFPATNDDAQWESEHPWVPFQRYLLTHVTNFMQLSIARVLAVQELGDSAGKYRHLALDSANRILSNYAQTVPRTYKLVWVVSASTVAAAIYVSVDMLAHQNDLHVQSRADVIEMLRYTATELKQYAAVANHAAHGSKTIQDLLQVINQQDSGISQRPTSIHDILRQISPTCSAESSPFADGLLQNNSDLDGMNIDEISAMLAGSENPFPGNLDSWNEPWLGF